MAFKIISFKHLQRSFLKIIICFFGLMANVGSYAAAGDDEHGSMTFKTTAHNFGSVYRGDKLSFSFEFTNTGKGILSVQGVHASCGCTAVEVDRGRKYQPGESGVVSVNIDTSDFIGAFQKAVVVMSNERLAPDRTLTLTAFIKADLEADPPMIDFGDVVSKDGAVKTVKVKSIGDFNLVIKDLVYNTAVFDVVLDAQIPKTEDRGGRTITVKLRPNLAPGFLKEKILIKNNSSHLAELPLPVRANVKGHIDFSPQYVEFGAIAPQETAERVVTVTAAADGGGVDITGNRAELTINGRRITSVADIEKVVTVKIKEELNSKDKKSIAVVVKNQAGMSGSVHGKVMLQTKDPMQSELAVDFYAFFR